MTEKFKNIIKLVDKCKLTSRGLSIVIEVS
jgi:hypothetical protein